MKVRQGFVSNSSSSSFIISSKESELCVNVPVILEPEKIISSIEELDEYFLELYLADALSELTKSEKENYDKCKDKLNNGEKIFIVCVKYTEEDLLCELQQGKNKNITLLVKE
jgi:hypothetical protein